MVEHIVVMGSSAGGPRILKEIFSGMPRVNAGIVLVQHMPAFINRSLQETIAQVTDMTVVIAQDGDTQVAEEIYSAARTAEDRAPLVRRWLQNGGDLAEASGKDPAEPEAMLYQRNCPADHGALL